MTTKTVAQAIAHCRMKTPSSNANSMLSTLLSSLPAPAMQSLSKSSGFCSHGQKISMAHPLARQRNLVTLPGRSRCIWRREHDNQT